MLKNKENKNSNYKYAKILQILILMAAILLLYYFAKSGVFDFAKIRDITFGDFLFISLLVNVTIILLGLKTKILVNHFDIKLSKTEWVGLGVINTFWNQLTVKGGIIARAVYLKNKNLSYSRFSFVVIAAHIFSLMLFSILSFVAFLVVSIYLKISLMKIIIFFLIIFIVAFLIIFCPLKSKNKIFKKFIRDWESIKKNKNLITKLFLIEFAIILIYSLRLKLIGDIFNYNLPFVVYLLLALFSNISGNVLNLVPGGLGIKEASSGLIFKIANLLPENGVMLTLVDRIISLIWIFPLGILFNLILFKTVNYRKLK